MDSVDEIDADAIDERPETGDGGVVEGALDENGSTDEFVEDDATVEDADGVDEDSDDEPDVDPVQAALESKLSEKEQLVSVLTERLERAAEQLDRIRRNGSDRKVVGGGIPPELLVSQKQVLEDISLAVERFEAANAAETLGRIETQLGEIRDLVVMGGGSGVGAAVRREQPVVAESSPAADAQSAWDAMKQRMLSGDSAELPPAESTDSDEPIESDEETPVAPVETPIVVEPIVEVEPLDPPPAIELESADRDMLVAAVQARDEYVAHLLGRLRAKEARGVAPVDWAALADAAPEDLQARLEALETKLQETLRRAEVEQSLERARLGRIESELEAKGHRIEKELQRLGVDDASVERDKADSSEKGPRWMRMLGLGNE